MIALYHIFDVSWGTPYLYLYLKAWKITGNRVFIEIVNVNWSDFVLKNSPQQLSNISCSRVCDRSVFSCLQTLVCSADEADMNLM